MPADIQHIQGRKREFSGQFLSFLHVRQERDQVGVEPGLCNGDLVYRDVCECAEAILLGRELIGAPIFPGPHNG